MTSVSVVIPTHNRADLVGRAISSVLAQTRPADEILVIDDGGADATEDVVRRFAGVPGSPRVRYERIDHRGVSGARNHGIGLASGDWLAFLDSDDEWLPEKLGAQLAALEAEPEHRVCHTDEIWIRGGKRVNPRHRHQKHGGWMYRHCLPLCAISPSSVMIHRDVFGRVGLFDEDLPACEDYDLWLRICALYPVLYVDRHLLRKYGGHDDQLSRTVEALDRYRIRALEKVLASGVLEDEDRRATEQMLAAKIGVYAEGAARRGRADEAARLRERCQRLDLIDP